MSTEYIKVIPAGKSTVPEYLGRICGQMYVYESKYDSIVATVDLTPLADEILAAYNNEHHCGKRKDGEGNVLPPHCGFADMKAERLSQMLARANRRVEELEAEVARLKEGKQCTLS